MCVWFSWSLDMLIFPASWRRAGRGSVSAARRAAHHVRRAVFLCRSRTQKSTARFIWTCGGRRSGSRVPLEWASLFCYYNFFFSFKHENLAVTQQRWHICTRAGCSCTSRKSTPACCEQKGCDWCRRPEWNINPQLLSHSESLQICSFWKMAATTRKYFSFHEAGRKERRWDSLFVCCGRIIINTVPPQLLRVADVRTTQEDIVRMMEGVYNCSTQSNHVMASSQGGLLVSVCFSAKFSDTWSQFFFILSFFFFRNFMR